MTCFGCGATIPEAPGVYYCDPCVKRQEREHGDEMAAFDAFHRFADSVGERGTDGG